MEMNPIPEAVLLCEKHIEGRVARQRSGDSPFLTANMLSANTTERRLIWSSSRPDNWEILVYNGSEGWEVCFFQLPLHHEHASGHSFESVRRRAEQRIRTFEAGRVRDASWRRPTVAAAGVSKIKPHLRPVLNKVEERQSKL
jgi:hypothetical protein